MVLVGQTCVNSNDGWSSVEILRLTFGQYFDPEVFEAGPWSRFWNKSLVTTLVEILRLKFGQDFEAEVRLIFWSWILVNLWSDLISLLWWEHSTLGSVVPLLRQYCISFATFLLFTTLQCFTFLPQPMLPAFIHKINPKMHFRWKSNTS